MWGGYSSGNAAKAFSAGISTTLTLLGFSLAMVLIGKFLVPGVARFPGAVTVGGIVGRPMESGRRCSPGFFFPLLRWRGRGPDGIHWDGVPRPSGGGASHGGPPGLRHRSAVYHFWRFTIRYICGYITICIARRRHAGAADPGPAQGGGAWPCAGSAARLLFRSFQRHHRGGIRLPVPVHDAGEALAPPTPSGFSSAATPRGPPGAPSSAACFPSLSFSSPAASGLRPMPCM